MIALKSAGLIGLEVGCSALEFVLAKCGLDFGLVEYDQ